MAIEILTPIFSAIGGIIGTVGLYAIIPNYITNRLTASYQNKQNALLEKTKNDYQKELEQYKIGILAVARYSDYQFKLYNELWISLYELKSKAEDLWEYASSSNLTKFAEQLKETKQKIGQNILLINDEHHEDLIRIMESFERYKVGKVSLINYRNNLRHWEHNNDNIGVNELNFINNNERIKNEYISLVEVLSGEFKKHLRAPI